MSSRPIRPLLAALALSVAPVAALAGGPPPAPPPVAPAKPAPSGVGIVFEKTTFAEALAKAKAATRPLFVDFFSEG